MAKKNEIIQTFEDADKKLFELAQLETIVAKKEAMMNKRIQDIKEEFDKSTSDYRATKTLIEKEIEDFLLINKAEFLKQRTRQLTHGSLGYRTNPPKVTQLNKKYSVGTTIELIKKILDPKKYIRSKEEINKDALLVDYAAKAIDDTQIASVGLKIDQADSPYYAINWEVLDQESASGKEKAA